MNRVRSAMVILGGGLNDDEFSDEVMRAHMLEEGKKAIQAQIEGVRIVTTNAFACTISVAGTREAITDLQDFVTKEGLGTVELDVFESPALRAANKPVGRLFNSDL